MHENIKSHTTPTKIFESKWQLQYDQLDIMINNPSKYESYQTIDLRGVAFTKWRRKERQTNEQTNQKTICPHMKMCGELRRPWWQNVGEWMGFVKHYMLEIYSIMSLKQQSAGRFVTQLGHYILTSSQSHFALIRCGEATNKTLAVWFQLTRSVALFTKILMIKKCRRCKTKIKKVFTKILTIILSVKIILKRVKLPRRKCKILNVREIFVLSFIVSEKIEKKMDDALALRLENKRAIHR